MITRESRVNDYHLTETRKVWHWAVFDVLGYMLFLTSNSWFKSPKLFNWVYEKYVKFTVYSRPYSTLVIKKMVNPEAQNDYSELLAEAIKKLEESPPPAIH